MHWILLSPNSVRYLPVLILTFLITLYLAGVKSKLASTKQLAWWFGILTLLNFTYFSSVSIYDAFWSALLSDFGGQLLVFLSTMPLLMFAYHFPRNFHPTESKAVVVLFLFLFLLLLALYIPEVLVNGQQFYNYQNYGFTLRRITPFGLTLDTSFLVLTTCGYLWAVFIFLRKTVALSGGSGEPTALSKQKPLSLPLLVEVVKKIIMPSNKEALACRSFALLIVIVAVVATLSMARFDVFFYTNASAVLLLAFVVTYLNNSLAPSSFRVKLIGITLCNVLLLMLLMENSVAETRLNGYNWELLVELEHVKTLLELGHISNAPSRILYIVSRLPEETNSYTPVLLRDNLTVEKILELEKYTKEQAIRYRASELQKVDSTLSAEQARLKATEEVALQPLPKLDSSYFRNEYSAPAYQFQTFNFVQGGLFYQVGYSYQDLRLVLHASIVTQVGLLLMATLIVLLIFPYLFYSSFTRPLQLLLQGVKKVDQGDFEVEVPIRALDEIGQLARSFNNMVVSIRRADRLKDEFLANTSHELRTPVNGIVGLTESMLDGATGPLSPVQSSNLEMVVSSGRRLASLINDLLDFSRLKHHELGLQKKPIWIYTAVEVVLTLSRSLVGSKKLVLVNTISPDSPPVMADENRIQQILFNLIGNAIKFTVVGRVEVSALVVGEYLAISVSDTGIGISEDKLGCIFESFEQVDGSISREYGGTGLGLTITRQLVNLHGGEIRAESSLGKGSCFTFTLPLVSAEAALNLAAPTSSPKRIEIVGGITKSLSEFAEALPEYLPTGDFKIMIVDDEPVNLQVLQNHLRLQGYHVIQAGGGLEALEMIGQGVRPDLMVLDIMMPRVSGYEVCLRIREAYNLTELPIVMLTAKTQINDLLEGFDSGANDYLTKPFSKNELLARIKTHLWLAKITAAYNRFVPHEFLQFLERESIVEVKLGDYVQKNMSIMFSDVRSFTSLSEKMTPRENFEFLNRFLSGMGPCIREYNGFIDKYIGDGIMALFPTSPDDALKAALAMQKYLDGFNALRQGLPPVSIGIGLHTGSLILGTIGELQHNQRLGS